MRSFTFFLLANIFLFLLVSLHVIGFFLNTRMPETATEEQLYYLLNNYEINMIGIHRTYDDILLGYNLIFATSTFFIGLFNLIFLRYLENNLPLYRTLLLLNIILWGLELIVFINFLVLPLIIIAAIVLSFFLTAYFMIGRTAFTKK